MREKLKPCPFCGSGLCSIAVQGSAEMGLEKVYCSVHGRCSKCELYVKGYCPGTLEWNWRDCPQRNPKSQDPRLREVAEKIRNREEVKEDGKDV